jgi:hypothetical protein
MKESPLKHLGQPAMARRFAGEPDKRSPPSEEPIKPEPETEVKPEGKRGRGRPARADRPPWEKLGMTRSLYFKRKQEGKL